MIHARNHNIPLGLSRHYLGCSERAIHMCWKKAGMVRGKLRFFCYVHVLAPIFLHSLIFIFPSAEIREFLVVWHSYGQVAAHCRSVRQGVQRGPISFCTAIHDWLARDAGPIYIQLTGGGLFAAAFYNYFQSADSNGSTTTFNWLIPYFSRWVVPSYVDFI